MLILSIVPIPLSGDTSDKNPSQRLAEIRSKIVVAEQRVRDLESLLTSLILQQALPQTISGVDNTDANMVRQELYRARAYEGELRTAEQFWNQIVESNKQAEAKTHEHFKAST